MTNDTLLQFCVDVCPCRLEPSGLHALRTRFLSAYQYYPLPMQKKCTARDLTQIYLNSEPDGVGRSPGGNAAGNMIADSQGRSSGDANKLVADLKTKVRSRSKPSPWRSDPMS